MTRVAVLTNSPPLEACLDDRHLSIFLVRQNAHAFCAWNHAMNGKRFRDRIRRPKPLPNALEFSMAFGIALELNGPAINALESRAEPASRPQPEGAERCEAP